MPFSVTASGASLANRSIVPRAGPPTIPAPPTETIDAPPPKDVRAPLPPVLAWPPRMVRRRCLRNLPALQWQAGKSDLHTYPGRVLRGTTQPPLLQAQPLLLTGSPLGSFQAAVAGGDSPQFHLGPSTYIHFGGKIATFASSLCTSSARASR